MLVVDFGGTILAGASGWRLNSAGHFAERHGLIVIVALGESIVAIGVGVAKLPISWPIIVASVLGLTVAGCLWWAYFDVVSIVAERALRRAQGEERARLARDAYSYLHLPMIAGIILGSLGLKKVLEYVADTSHHELSDPLATLPLWALYGGTAVYLLAHVAFRFRIWHHVSWQRGGGRGGARVDPIRHGDAGARRPGPAHGRAGRTDRVRSDHAFGIPRAGPSRGRRRRLPPTPER